MFFACFFQFGDVDYFTWSDRQGEDHPLLPTNSSCNLKSPVWMSNKEEVTDITQLPIKNIKYGPLKFELEQVKVIIGPIVCQPSENNFSIKEQMLKNQIEELKNFDKVIKNKTGNLRTIITENFEIVTNQTEELRDIDRVIKDENENLKTNIAKNLKVEVENIQKDIIELKKGINECLTNPCQNQGTCTDIPSGYSCTCVPGFTGKNCEVNIDECSENPCVHGTCTDEINSYKCVCETGYVGLNCDSQTPPCPTNDPNYHKLNDHCIFFEKSSKNYEDAKQNCETKFDGRGKLFEPKTWSENEMAYKIAKLTSCCWWIGVKDKQTEGSFVYESNGSPISYTPKFFSGYDKFGSKGTSNNCIRLYTPSTGHESDIKLLVVHWLDNSCTNSYYSICENST